MTTPVLATIGYEGSTQDAVLIALLDAGVRHLIDVRAIPQSRKPGFSRRLLAASAEARGLEYTHLRGLGTPKAGRDAVRHGDVATMEAIFSEHMTSDVAQADLARAKTIARETSACLLCFEREHTNCHRRIVAELIAEETGQPIRHLHPGS